MQDLTFLAYFIILQAIFLINQGIFLQTIRKMIYQPQETRVLLEFATSYEEQALQLLEELNKFSLTKRKQGKKWKEAVLPKLQSAFQLLQQSINFYDICNKIQKAIALCVLSIRTCYIYTQAVNGDQNFANKIQIQIFQLVKNTLQKNLVRLEACSQLQIGCYLSITTFYKGLNRKKEYELFVKQFLTIICSNPDKKYKQHTLRNVVMATYEDRISFMKNSRKQIWNELLKFQLWQDKPNYRVLYNINGRFGKEIYKEFIFLLLLGEFNGARQFLKKKVAQDFKFIWIKLQFLQKLVDFKEAGDLVNCKKIIDGWNFKNYRNIKKMSLKLLLDRQ